MEICLVVFIFQAELLNPFSKPCIVAKSYLKLSYKPPNHCDWLHIITMTTSVTKPLILVTGANQGIGLEIVRHLTNEGKHHVLLAARTMAKAESAAAEIKSADITPIVINMSSDDSIAAAVEFVKSTFGKLDILVNNAGISKSPDPNAMVRENYHAVFDTNAAGVAVLTDGFIPLIRASDYHDRRIVNVTSQIGYMGLAYSKTYEFSLYQIGVPAYRVSKSALNMITAYYAVMLKDEGILVTSSSPGFCRTEFTGGQGYKTAAEGAVPIVRATVGGDREKLFATVESEEFRVEEYGW